MSYSNHVAISTTKAGAEAFLDALADILGERLVPDRLDASGDSVVMQWLDLRSGWRDTEALVGLAEDMCNVADHPMQVIRLGEDDSDTETFESFDYYGTDSDRPPRLIGVDRSIVIF